MMNFLIRIGRNGEIRVSHLNLCPGEECQCNFIMLQGHKDKFKNSSLKIVDITKAHGKLRNMKYTNHRSRRKWQQNNQIQVL
jgi:hypothetical protein